MGDTIEEQTRQAIDNIEAILQADGASLDDVVKVNVHLLDTNLFPATTRSTRRGSSSRTRSDDGRQRPAPGARDDDRDRRHRIRRRLTAAHAGGDHGGRVEGKRTIVTGAGRGHRPGGGDHSSRPRARGSGSSTWTRRRPRTRWRRSRRPAARRSSCRPTSPTRSRSPAPSTVGRRAVGRARRRRRQRRRAVGRQGRPGRPDRRRGLARDRRHQPDRAAHHLQARDPRPARGRRRRGRLHGVAHRPVRARAGPRRVQLEQGGRVRPDPRHGQRLREGRHPRERRDPRATPTRR